MGSDNYATIPLQSSLDQLAIARAGEAIQKSGLALPCQVTAVDGSIVTVSFEVSSQWTLPPVTIPKAESQWLRSPTQVGDFGVVQPASAALGGISGLGAGVANVPQEQGNLSNLVFVPVAALTFPTVPSNVGPNRPWLNGPAGAAVGDTAWTAYTLHDGAGGTVSVVAPASTGRVVLGGLASVSGNIAAARAVVANADLGTMLNNQISTLIGYSHQQLLAAIITAGGLPTGASATALLATLRSGGFPTTIPGGGFFSLLPDLNGIAPPACSSIVRVVS